MIYPEFLAYSFPDYVLRLLPEYWADLDGDWIDSFVNFSRTINDGTELIESVPIRPEVYLMAPTFWASSPDGNLSIMTHNLSYSLF